MPTSSGPNTLGEGNLIFAYDTGDVSNSYRGRPTLNASAGYSVYNYNNVPGNVTTSITATGQTYKGAAIYQQTITPLDATGVSYLTNANNPGIGVYTLGGGGTGGQYSGYSIFFKPVGPMFSTPIYTHYSNIGGWQSTSNYEDMGDGWFRAKVLWYSASTLSDQKYWAINPAGAIANIPITIYWAGPFRENLNSTTISQFVEDTRTATQGLLPVIGSSSLSLSNVSFDSNAQMVFDGTDDYIATSTAIPCNFGTGDFTVEVMIYPQSFASYTHMVALPSQSTFALKANISDGAIYYYDPAFSTYGSTSGWTLTLNQWNHVVLVRSGNIAYGYLNGALKGSKVGFNTNFSSTQIVNVGNGGTSEYTQKEVDIVKIYNRALTAQEIRQNYQQYKTRFNLS